MMARRSRCDVVALPESQRLRRAIIVDQRERRQLRPVRAVEELVHDVRAYRGDEYESFQHRFSIASASLRVHGAAHAALLPLSLLCLLLLQALS